MQKKFFVTLIALFILNLSIVLAHDEPSKPIQDAILGLSQQGGFIFLGACIVAFVFGIFHSFAPGHGKSLVLAYLLGRNVRMKSVLLLSLSTALTHVADVLILSLLVFLVLPNIAQASVMSFLEKSSGILILFFGFYIIFKTLRANRHHHHHDHDHDAHGNVVPHDSHGHGEEHHG